MVGFSQKNENNVAKKLVMFNRHLVQLSRGNFNRKNCFFKKNHTECKVMRSINGNLQETIFVGRFIRTGRLYLKTGEKELEGGP